MNVILHRAALCLSVIFLMVLSAHWFLLLFRGFSGLSAILLVTTCIFWALILYSLPLALSGTTYRRHRLNRAPDYPEEWPGVTIMIPAHNEDVVIEKSLRRFLALDYPKDKLHILVIDDASDDNTGIICDRMSAEFSTRVRVLHRARPIGGQGKAAACNHALTLCDQPYIAIYDADSRPRPSALKKLVSELEAKPGYVAAVGRLVKLNRKATFFNRFVSFEYICFQWSIQAGRKRLFDIVLLTGTHFLIRTDVIKSVDGWDERALAEDFELSIRLYARNLRSTFVPEAVSEEQDPQKISVWFRQRSRWMMGNFYSVIKHLRATTFTANPRTALIVLEMAVIFFAGISAIIVSDALLIASLSGLVSYTLAGPFVIVWILAMVIFILIHQLAQAAEGEDSWRTPLIAIAMYAFYTQLWLVVFFRSLYTYIKKRGRVAWVKTPRIQY